MEWKNGHNKFICNGDKLKIKLNCKDWTLSFQINQNGPIVVFDKIGIRQGTYSAIVRLDTVTNSRWEMIQYQMTY